MCSSSQPSSVLRPALKELHDIWKKLPPLGNLFKGNMGFWFCFFFKKKLFPKSWVNFYVVQRVLG